jgi:hypothetical protein
MKVERVLKRLLRDKALGLNEIFNEVLTLCYSTSLMGLPMTAVIRAPCPLADPRARGLCQDKSDHADQDERASTDMITLIIMNLLNI